MAKLWVVLGVLFALAVSGCVSSGPTPPAPAGPSPSVETTDFTISAFKGLGQLAYVRDGRLFILNGESAITREVAGAAPARNPSWSADGRWLAFRRTVGDQSHLMFADAATGTARELTGLPDQVTGFAWSPVGSALAVSTAESRQLFLLQDPGRPESRMVAQSETPMGALRWSPDGSRIAYVTTLPFADVTQRSDALEVVPVAGGAPERWFTAEGSGIDLAGWSPDGLRLLFWVRPMHCNSCAADGLPLHSLTKGAKEPVRLPDMLLNTRWLSWGRSATELLMVRGGGRIAWDMKNLAICDIAAGACRDLPQDDGVVSLDAVWSPDGKRIAFVKADRRPGEWGFSSKELMAAWVGSHSLWLISPDGTGQQAVTAAGAGIYSPAWAKDGRHILYIRDNALWVVDLDLGKAQEIASLGGEDDQFGFYGQRTWSHLFAWYTGS